MPQKVVCGNHAASSGRAASLEGSGGDRGSNQRFALSTHRAIRTPRLRLKRWPSPTPLPSTLLRLRMESLLNMLHLHHIPHRTTPARPLSPQSTA